LWAIHRHHGTVSGAPNFAYELCLRKIEDRDLEGLDLSTWRLAYNGAEPVSPDTVAGFIERFAKYGFRAEAMAPVFGLAECAVGLTCPVPGSGARIDRVQREPFMASGRALAADRGDARALRFVACGRPLPEHEIRVVDAAGHETGERQQGRLEFRGPSATSGYFRNPEQTRKLFHGDWLDTGDLAYVAAGDLYVTGRAKDLIIRGGRHIHPYELEDAIGAIPGIRRGCVAVFGSPDSRSGTERLIVLAETRESDLEAKERLRRAIIDRALGILGMPPDDIVLAAPHTVLKTSSGKIRRAASREFYERGSAALPQRPVWWQLARLGLAGAAPQARRWWHAFGALLYAAHAWAMFGLLAPPTWLLVVLLPRLSWRWGAARAASRLLVRLCGVPLAVSGLENVQPDRSCIVIANHASYLDGMFLAVAWPEPLRFVAKVEFRAQFVAGLFLKRLGAEFVERFDFKRGAEDADRLIGSARARLALAFFPEGTFTRRPGLAPFHLGAFVVAAQAGLPIVPVTIRGTRSVLRSGSWLPRRSPVAVVISAPIAPEGNDWQAVMRLRNAARTQILRDCAEPDLAD
jgi:1-acyl-sn-glycerol-3-phosphate acyltransferase